MKYDNFFKIQTMVNIQMYMQITKTEFTVQL